MAPWATLGLLLTTDTFNFAPENIREKVMRKRNEEKKEGRKEKRQREKGGKARRKSKEKK